MAVRASKKNRIKKTSYIYIYIYVYITHVGSLKGTKKLLKSSHLRGGPVILIKLISVHLMVRTF